MATETKAGASVTSASVSDRKSREILHLLARVARGFLLVDLGGYIAGEMYLQPGRQVRLVQLPAHRVHQVDRLLIAAAADLPREHDYLLRVAVGGPAEVTDPLDQVDRGQVVLQPADGRDVGSGQRAGRPGRHHRDWYQVRGTERRREGLRMDAGRARRQELGVVVLGNAG